LSSQSISLKLALEKFGWNNFHFIALYVLYNIITAEL